MSALTEKVICQQAMAFLEEAAEHGWTVAYVPGKDTGGHPYASVEAIRVGDQKVRITWHTRNTGTFRLLACMVGNRDVSLKKAREYITEAGHA